jgi:ABC-type cobalamin/Fe3+-siderophores transport system ATPase subunit
VHLSSFSFSRRKSRAMRHERLVANLVLLNVDSVECRYGSVKVLEDVSLSVKGGDFVGILGPNGSGKTTLLKSISRTLKPHKGTILLNEADIYSLKSVDVAKQMAVVPQETSIGFNFSALDIVLMGRNPEPPQHLAFGRKTNKRVKRRRETARNNCPRFGSGAKDFVAG